MSSRPKMDLNTREITSEDIKNMKSSLRSQHNRNNSRNDDYYIYHPQSNQSNCNNLNGPVTNINERHVRDDFCSRNVSGDSSCCRYSMCRNFTNDDEDISTTELLMKTYQQQKKEAEEDFAFNYGARKILEHMYKMWLRQVMCDLNIVTKGGCILTHQVLLSTYSPSLAKLFSPKTTQRVATINLKSISREIVADVLNFLYTADIQLSCRIIDDIVCCAEDLDLEIVKEVCSDFLSTSLDEENIILHYCVASNNKLEKGKSACLDYIAKNFERTQKHSHFMLLTVEQIEGIVKHKDIISDVDKVLELITTWIDYNVPMRISHVEYLFLFLPPHRINARKLDELTQKYDWLLTNENSREIIFRIYKIKSSMSQKPVTNFNLDETDDKIQEISDKLNKSHPDDWKLMFKKKQ